MRFASVEPSPAALVRAAFNRSSPFRRKKIPDTRMGIWNFWYAERDSNPRPTGS